MKKFWLTFALGALLACGYNALKKPSPQDARTIVAVGMYLTPDAWRATPWYRVSDREDVYPIYVMMSIDGSACRIDAGVWATVLFNDQYPCETRWVPARAR